MLRPAHLAPFFQFTSLHAPKHAPKHALKALSSTLSASSQARSQLNWIVYSQPSRLYAPKYTLEYALKYAPNCTRWHTHAPSLLGPMLPSTLSRRSRVHSRVHSEVHSRQRSQDDPKYTPEYALKYTPEYASSTLASLLLIARSQSACLYAPNCTRLYPPSLLSVYSKVHSHDALKHTPDYPRLHTHILLGCTILCTHPRRALMCRSTTLGCKHSLSSRRMAAGVVWRVWCGGRRVAGSVWRQGMVAEITTSVDIIV
jgi:hypothetical protein